MGTVAPARIFSEKQLRSFPDIGRDDLIRYFTLTQADMASVDPGRGPDPADRLAVGGEFMTRYLDLPGRRGKLDRLVSEFGAVLLAGPPGGLDDVPPGKALVCVGDMGEYEAPGYILTEAEFAAWTDPAAGCGRKTWLLMDQQTADRLCPDAVEDRRYWQSALERDAEAVAHTDNLIPVARASRSGLRRDVGLLRQYAAVLRGELTGTRADELLTDVRSRRIVSADLDAIAKDLESWAERDWVAVIDIGPEREHLAGKLPPFPGPGA